MSGPFDRVLDKLRRGETVTMVSFDEPQFPRTDGSFDPWVLAAMRLAEEWMTYPYPLLELPQRARTTGQWLVWLHAEGFIEEAEQPYGYWP